MNAINLIEKLKQKTTFKVENIERIALCNRNYAKIILNRLLKRGLIKRITKNSYTVHKNAFVVASNITYPSYLSLLSASYFLGYTEQIPNTMTIATTRKVKGIIFEDYKIKFVPIKEFFGYRKIKTEEGDIFIVENEKLVIDCFLRHKEMGNFDEINKVITNAPISKDKIIEYLKRTDIQTITKRVGYSLERMKKIDISDYFVFDNNYTTLNPFSKKYKKTITKWRIKE